MNTAILPVIQRVNPSFYINTPNREGEGVVYIRYRVGGILYRVSTGVKVKEEYWSKAERRIVLKGNVSRLDWEIYNHYSEVLNSLRYEVEKKKEYYLCDTSTPISCKSIGDDIAQNLNPIYKMKKKNTTTSTISLTSLMKGIVMDMDNKTSQRTLLGTVSTFSRFLTEKGIEDCVSSLNMSTMRMWRDWLAEGDFAVTRAVGCFSYIFTLATKLERKYDYDFQLNKSKIEPIRDKRTQEEKRDNGIALTSEEIERLVNIDLTERKKLVTARDMFLLQCWCGCRVEDLPLLLTGANITKDSDGVIHSTFVTQKRGITSIIPLNTLFPRAIDLVEKYVNNCPVSTRHDQMKYNGRLKELAKLAGLDRKIKYTGQRGGKKHVDVNPLYEVISSHDGRHTFITNCIREKGLTPDKVKLMSGHADTKLIESVYTNLTREDSKNVLKKAIQETKGKNSTGESTHRENESATESNARGESGVKSPVEFALWLLSALGIEVKGSLDLAELVEKIVNKKAEIKSKYGEERYEEIKHFLGVGLGEIDKERLGMLFTKATKRKVRVNLGNYKRVIKRL